MLDFEKLAVLAADAGFTCSGKLDVSTLEFLPEVRDMCSADKCHNYNRSWSCPPAVPSLEEMREKVKQYSEGLLVQTVTQLEDGFDFEGMMDAGKRHGAAFYALWRTLRELYPELYPMGSGGCTRCEKCTYPDAPCRFPDELMHSMEACGLLVSKVCTDNGMKYNHGKDTLAYTACFLLE
jgi:predicted metal-binding protein